MKLRADRMNDPPNRLPYLKAIVSGETFWARVPSLLTISQLGKALDRASLVPMVGLATAVAGGQALLSAFDSIREGGEGVVELAGCLIGVSWADPAWELETERPSTWTTESMARFGAAVFEELHEAGWTLGHEVGLMLAIIEQIQAATSIESEVLERARFFGRPKVTSTGAPSTPSASSSAADPEPSGN